MRPSTVKALLKRELLDILRDKKTVITMVVLPILLYPLLIIGMMMIITAITSSQEEKEYSVYLDISPEVASTIRQICTKEEEEIGYHLKFLSEKQLADAYEEKKESAGKKSSGKKEVKKPEDPGSGQHAALCRKALNVKAINAYVTKEGEKEYTIRYLSANTDSSIAKNALQQAFNLYKDDLRKEEIEKAGLAEDAILDPILVSGHDMSSTEESVGNQIGSLLPFFIITSVLMGALYPSIDVTAGEKERGTLETLLTLPVTNFEMILSKFLAVAMIACVSAFLNIVSMGGAMMFLVSGAMNSAKDSLNVSIDYSVFLPGIGFTLVVMLFFAMLVTAVCMCTCIFAKSFKEANNYATPVMLIFMFGGYATLLPNVELTQKTAVLPIVNVALLIKSLFGFSADYGLFAMVLFSNVAYSLLAVLILSRLYNSEAVLFSEGFSSVRLFTRRSDMKEKQMPGGGDVIIVITLTLLLMLYLGSFAVARFGFAGVAMQQAMVLLCPILYAFYIKADIKKLFSIRKPRLTSFPGALFMFVGGFILAMALSCLLAPLFPESTKNVMDLSEFLGGQNRIATVIVIALMPAIGEELLFRGFLMGTLREKAKPVMAIAITAILFAAFHMSVLRFFTVGVIGLCFTVAAYKSRCIFVSMLMHFCNNLTACLVQWYPGDVTSLLTIDTIKTVNPLFLTCLLAGGIALVLAGYFLIGSGERKKAASAT